LIHLLQRLLKQYKKAPNEVLRRATQLTVVFILLLAAWQFSAFLEAVRGAVQTGEPYRPPVVEGFLPIAAIMALRAWMATGVFDPLHPAGLVVLVATLATAWLFRRALCGWICPLGALSEALGALGKKLLGRTLAVPKWVDRGLLAVKYALLAWIFNVFFLIPAGQAVAFLRLPYYAVSDVKMFEMFTNLGPLGLGIIGGMAVFSIFIKSFWCRYLCPYGALQGVLGLLSPILLQRDKDACVSCNRCNEVCPNRVDVAHANGLVVTSECMGCTACVSACPKEGALRLRLLGLATLRPLVFAVAFLVVFFGAVQVAKLTGHWGSSLTVEQYQGLYRVMSAPSGR
jgi:polyferredoxin